MRTYFFILYYTLFGCFQAWGAVEVISQNVEYSKMNLTHLPPPIKALLFNYMPYEAQLNVAQTSKENKHILTNVLSYKKERELKELMTKSLSHFFEQQSQEGIIFNYCNSGLDFLLKSSTVELREYCSEPPELLTVEVDHSDPSLKVKFLKHQGYNVEKEYYKTIPLITKTPTEIFHKIQMRKIIAYIKMKLIPYPSFVLKDNADIILIKNDRNFFTDQFNSYFKNQGLWEQIKKLTGFQGAD